ncbi:hypothetical protein GCM10007304_14730 [Rhodococcoides trifolii]|uniref:Uncharacterized protein n=1 Tax=Rhodococcoides trifolii TaxID=908250 RepID=A0A917D099_9NOCA|nr:hypothetical protein GCM10007304_14730 [Rhodococcus trifolii]
MLVGLVRLRPNVTTKRVETVLAHLESLGEVGKASATADGKFRYRISDQIRDELRVETR